MFPSKVRITTFCCSNFYILCEYILYIVRIKLRCPQLTRFGGKSTTSLCRSKTEFERQTVGPSTATPENARPFAFQVNGIRMDGWENKRGPFRRGDT